ncbi:MAG: rod shape-determining protein MreC, partial [Cyclobacteriaceae bacterium]|nr:rod shape-determining protein MreC [Cyclobacteriaceae bacterium]
MYQIFKFLFRFRALLFFVLLEFIAILMVLQNNQYHRARIFNSSNSFFARTLELSDYVADFFLLREENQQLVEENALLHKKLKQLEQSIYSINSREITDPDLINQYNFIGANVINSSVYQISNHITVDKGALDGVRPGMSVFSAQGVVGKVRVVSDHFAVINSLLDTDFLISSRIKSNGEIGTVRWNGENAGTANLDYIARHIKLQKGDTVVTSGFNAVFPPG